MQGNLRKTRGKKKSNKRGARSQSQPPGRRTSRRDMFGREYGGVIASLDLHRAQDFPPKPKKGLADADYSTCQAINSFAISTGIGAGTGDTPPYIVAAPSVNSYFSMAFSLQDLSQAATLTALFDQYRIDKVVVKFVPQAQALNVMNVASPNNSVPALYAVLDFDDATALTSLAAATQYDNVQIVPYGEGLDITVWPSNTPALYASGAFSGYEVQKAQWVDCANTAVGHYGIKGLVTSLLALSTSNVVWDIYSKYYVSFRNTR